MKAVPAELKLIDEAYGGDTVIIRPAKPGAISPVLCKEWSPGSPSVREVANDLVGTDGVADQSFFTGARNITMDLQIFGTPLETPYSYLERITAMCHPTRRPWLYVTRDNGEEWRIQLRGSEFSIAYGRMAAVMLEVQITFTGPAGMFESPQREAHANAASVGWTGQIWPETWPENFGSGNTGGPPFDITVDSSVPVEPTLRIVGPSTGPIAKLPSSGEQFAFEPTFTIYAGQYVEVDMRAGTVLQNGDPTASVFTHVDWTTSTFWRLPPGPNTIGFTGSGGLIYIYWRDRRLTA
jgi:hypothetical protein